VIIIYIQCVSPTCIVNQYTCTVIVGMSCHVVEISNVNILQ